MEKVLSASVPSVAIKTPFDYKAGVNYESWTMGRTNMNVSTDLTCVAQHFSLLKTFHCAAVGTTNVVMDPTQQQVINFVVNHQGQALELIMGTNSSSLAQGGFGSPWTPGLMTTSTYTDQWVAMLITAFGGVATTLKHLKCICLGNEVDANGPPATDPNFNAYYQTWIPAAFTNLKKSLSNLGLGSIPVTTIIANYPLGAPSSNIVASSVTSFVNSNWPSTWNSNNCFVFFNQYTADGGKSTDFNAVSAYFKKVQAKLSMDTQVFVGETGYSAEFDTPGHNNEATVISEMFTWLSSQINNDGACTPLCVFQAFDHSGKPAGQQQMGLFEYNTNGKAQMKSGIVVPAWVNTK